MARATLALLLTAALYLGLALLSSTDENLLLNAQVAIPQIGFGIALDKSYIFGPPIFLYLHVQGLFLLSVLYRKIQKFETALDQRLSGIPNSDRERQEYWNLLSAFAFVQLFRRNGHFPYVSILLAWISIEAIPLALLFAADLSFVRYQSYWITNSHHITVLLALISVVWFNWQVFERRFRLRWALIRFVLPSSLVLLLFFQAQPPSFDIKSIENKSIEIIAKKKATQESENSSNMIEEKRFIWRTGREYKPLSSDIKSTEAITKKTATEIFADMMEEKRNRIWRTGSEEFWQTMWKAIQGRGMNVFDIVLCKQLDLVCRYLNVNGLWLVSTRPADALVSEIDVSSEVNSGIIQWSSLNEFSLADRSLRFADFRDTKLQGMDLENADLQGANLERVNFQNANLSKAKMHGASLTGAKLQDANISGAELWNANFQYAELQRASLNKARLWSAYFEDAKLQRANLTKAELQGANMKSAHMDGASLREAKLAGTNLKGAWLRGASLARAKLLGTNLQEAQLQGANLYKAILEGVNLKRTQLEGVDLHSAEIRCSFGEPESWKLAWMPDASITCSPDFFEKLTQNESDSSKNNPDIVLWWNGDKIQGKLVFMEYMDNIPEISKRDWLLETNLHQVEWVIFDKRPMLLPADDYSEFYQKISRYLNTWSKWTEEFACKGGYRGYASVKRWNSKNPLFELDKHLCPDKPYNKGQCSILDNFRNNILKKLKSAAPKCPGLRIAPDAIPWISDNDWRDAWHNDD